MIHTNDSIYFEFLSLNETRILSLHLFRRPTDTALRAATHQLLRTRTATQQLRIAPRTFLGPLRVIRPNEQFAVVAQCAFEPPALRVFVECDREVVGSEVRCLEAEFRIIRITNHSHGDISTVCPLLSTHSPLNESNS